MLPGGAQKRLAQAVELGDSEPEDDASDMRSTASSYKTPSCRSLVESHPDETPAAAVNKSVKLPELCRARRGQRVSTGSAASGRKASPMSVRSAGASTVAAAATVVSPSERHNSDTEDPDEIDEDLNGPPGSRAGKMDKASRVKHNAEKELASMLSMYGEDAHYKNAKKKKHLSTRLVALRKWARACGQLSGDEAANSLCERIFAETEEIESRQAFFEASKVDFIKFVLAVLSEDLEKIIASLSPDVLCQIISRGCAFISALAITDADAAQALFLALAGDGVAKQGLRLIKVYKADLHLAVTYQKTCMVDHLEQVLKQADLKTLVQAARHVTKPLELYGDEALVKDLNSAQITSGETLDIVAGWPAEVFADLVCVSTMGRFGVTMVESSKPARETIHMCQAVIDNASKISARIRCYHKTLNGSGVHPAKRIWTGMIEAAKTLEATLGITVEPDKVLAWIKVLLDIGLDKPKTQVDGDKVLDALVDATDGDESEEVRKFAVYSASLSPTSTGDDGKLFAMARQYRELLISGLSSMVHGVDYHADVVRDVPTDFVIRIAAAATNGADSDEVEVKDPNVVVHDAKYFEDPENVPEEVGMVKLTGMVCDLLKQFGESAEKLFTEVQERCSLHEKFWKIVRYDITPQYTLVAKFKAMVEIYKSDLWVPSNNHRPADDNDSLWVLQIFLDKAASSGRFCKSICNFLEQQYSVGGPTSLALSRECIALEPTLPKEAVNIVKAGRAFESIEEIHAKITAGKQIGSLNDVSESIGNCKFATSVCQDALIKRAGLDDAMKSVKNEFEKQITLFEQKLKRGLCAATELVVKYGSVMAKIPTWSFDDLPWLKAGKENPDLHLKSLIQNTEQLSVQGDHFKTTISRLAVKQDWMPEELAERVKNLKHLINEKFDEKLTEAKRVLANVTLLNVILTAKPNTPQSDWPALCSKALKYLRNPALNAEHLIHHSLESKVKVTTAPSGPKSKKGMSGQNGSQTKTAETDTVDETLLVDSLGAAAASSASSAAASSAAAQQQDVPVPKKRRISFAKKTAA